ncbi:MAG TPA: sigma 54-interacting transcriptional regulator, partial [Usitatibacter sp.]
MKVLVVEDDSETRRGVQMLLEQFGLDVKAASTLAEGRAALASFEPDVCLTDLQLPDGDGIELIRVSRASDPGCEVVVLTGHGSLDTAVEAMKAGAFAYLVKPLRGAQLEAVLERLRPTQDPGDGDAALWKALDETGRFGEMVGVSGAMREMCAVIARIARSDAPVMITGESGSGKEAAAQTIHALSRRRKNPLVAINCGAVSANLIESELFGHEKGAFTGAEKRRAGYFELAQGGTLFLDEVTEMSLELQVKFLRVLETRSFRRVGGNEEIGSDLRIVSSSNRDLLDAIEKKILREDLYYRLNVFPILLPPLRERAGDITLLAEHFVQKYARSFGKAFKLLYASSGEQALELARENDIAAVVTDQRMPRMTGLELLRAVRDVRPDAIGIIVTAFTDVDVLIESINLGRIYRYVTKPWDSKEMRGILTQAIERFHLGRENRRLSEQLAEYAGMLASEAHGAFDFGVIVGDSPALREVLARVEQVAQTSATVLLRGETGTGKEMVARAIHINSARETKPFIKVNCAAL